MSRPVSSSRPPTVPRGPAILLGAPPKSGPSPDENVVISKQKYQAKLEPQSKSASPDHLFLHAPYIGIETTPGSTSNWNQQSPASSTQKHEKARRKLILDGGSNAKKAKVNPPVSHDKTSGSARGNGERVMDPSTISLADDHLMAARRHRQSAAGRGRSSSKYALSDELGPDPTELSDDWMRLFSPTKGGSKRVKLEPMELEELLEEAAPMTSKQSVMRSAQKTKKDTRGSPSTPGGGRLENSLLVLTKKFIGLRNVSEELNLNEAASTLGVQKRRLYDITNVLEGIDMVVKTGKNSIRWCSMGAGKLDDGRLSDCAEKEALEAEVAALAAEEQRLDDLIRDLRSAFTLVKEDPTDKPYAYVPYRDINQLVNADDTKMVIAVQAGSSDATIEVADPVETQRFEMGIQCSEGLHALLIPSGRDDERGGASHHPPPLLANGGVFSGRGAGGGTGTRSKASGRDLDKEGSIVLPPSSGGAASSSRQPCDDLITPSKMVEDSSCLSDYLSPLKFLIGSGPPIGLLSSQDSPFLTLDTQLNGATAQQMVRPDDSSSSSQQSGGGPSSLSYYHPTYMDAPGPSLSDVYHDGWF